MRRPLSILISFALTASAPGAAAWAGPIAAARGVPVAVPGMAGAAGAMSSGAIAPGLTSLPPLELGVAGAAGLSAPELAAAPGAEALLALPPSLVLEGGGAVLQPVAGLAAQPAVEEPGPLSAARESGGAPGALLGTKLAGDEDAQLGALETATLRGRPMAAVAERFRELRAAFGARFAGSLDDADGVETAAFALGRQDAARALAGEPVAVPADPGFLGGRRAWQERLAGAAAEAFDQRGTPPQALILRALEGRPGEDMRVVIDQAGTEPNRTAATLAAPTASMALAPSAVPAATAQEAAEPARLLYDVHDPAFRAGYLAAMAWEQGSPAPPIKSADRERFLAGAAYRAAEVAGDAGAAAGFLVKASGGLRPAFESFLAGQLPAPALRANLADEDFVQGYMTAAAWRPGKQLWMPAPTFWQRLNPRAWKGLKVRDERFISGVYAALGESADPNRQARLRAALEGGPAVGSREFAEALPYALEAVLAPAYDATLEQRLPFVPGKVRIPRSIVGLTLGHIGLIVTGIEFHKNAQPFLVLGLTGSKAMMGVIRNYHYTSYMVSNLFPIGPTIDKTDFRTLFIWTSVARALLMAAIPLLFFSGWLSFAVLAGIVIINPFFQSLMTNSDQTARTVMLRKDPNLVREGAAYKEKFSAVVGLVMPFLVAYAVSLLVQTFGDPGGFAMAYAAYAASLLLAVPVFRYLVRDPRHHDPAIKSKPSANPLNVLQPLWAAVSAPARGVLRLLNWLLRRALRPVGDWRLARRTAITLQRRGWPRAGLALSRALRGLRARPASAPDDPARAAVLSSAAAREVPLEPLGRIGRGIERLARFFDRHAATQGVAVILRSQTLRILVLVGAVELFLADAMMFVVVPNYIVDVIHPRAELASWPVIGTLLSTRAGIMGLMFGLANVGAYLAARWVSGPAGQARIQRLGHPFFYRAAAVGSLLFWAMMVPLFLTPPGAAAALPLFFASLGVFLAMQFLTTLLHRPLTVVMAQVQRAQIPDDRAGRVIQAFTMIDVGLMALGGLLVGLLIDQVAIGTAVLVLSIGVTVTAILQWLAPRWLGAISPPGWEPGGASPPKAADPAKTARLPLSPLLSPEFA